MTLTNVLDYAGDGDATGYQFWIPEVEGMGFPYIVNKKGEIRDARNQKVALMVWMLDTLSWEPYHWKHPETPPPIPFK